jgi:uncharacterized membrane protein
MKLNRTEAFAGGLFIFFGMAFLAMSLRLDLGTALRMGPGYFPLILSAILLLLGLAILVNAFKSVSPAGGTTAWRGILLILPAPIVFGLTVRGLGFVPAIFLATLVAALAARKMPLWQVLVLALGVTVFATLVFSYALGLPFRRFGPWVDF